MIRPAGYYVLVKMEEVVKEVEEGSLKGFVLQSKDLHEREQSGHDVGVLVSLGPTSFSGFQGIDCNNPEGRAEQWGVYIGNKVEFNRYDGKTPNHKDYKNYRIIQDAHIIGVIED